MIKTSIICIVVMLVWSYTYAQTGSLKKIAGTANAAKTLVEVPAPSAPDLDLGSDSGSSASDNLTNSSNPSFTISGLLTGATVELLRNGTPVASGVASGSSLTLNDASPPSDAVVQYTARQTLGQTTSLPSTALQVTFDRTSPTVTIDQTADQADPATTLRIRFTVKFDEPVECTLFPDPFPLPDQCFGREELSLANSTAYTNAALFWTSGTGTEYLVEVGFIRSPGTVILSMPAMRLRDRAGNWNAASTSVDNVVNFQPVPYTGSLSGRVVTTSGGVPHAGLLMWLTDSTTGAFYIAPVTPSGYYKFKNLPLYVGVESPMFLEVRRKKRLVSDGYVQAGDYTHPDFVIQY